MNNAVYGKQCQIIKITLENDWKKFLIKMLSLRIREKDFVCKYVPSNKTNYNKSKS